MPGAAGPRGLPGLDGCKGDKGDTGSIGCRGPNGATGPSVRKKTIPASLDLHNLINTICSHFKLNDTQDHRLNIYIAFYMLSI